MMEASREKCRVVPAILVGVLVLGAAVGAASGRPEEPAVRGGTAATLVVDDDGGGDYESVQAAVDAASPGDTVEVRPGTYEERVVVDVTVTVVAPRGATLDGTAVGGTGIEIVSDAEPVVEGLVITGFEDGVVAVNTTGAWTLRNVTVEGNGNDGVAAGASSGAWTIRDSTIGGNDDEGIDVENTSGPWTLRNVVIRRSGDDGIDADGADATASWTILNTTIRQSNDDGIDVDNASGDWTIRGSVFSGNSVGVQIVDGTGDWTIRGTVIRNNSRIGVVAAASDGNWTIRNSHLRYNLLMGVLAVDTTGDWTIEDTTVRNSNVGVNAGAASGAWRILNSSIRSTTVPRFFLPGEGTGVFAVRTTGSWEIHNSTLSGHPNHAVNATGATVRGDATRNWWGRPDGPSGEDCVGNVTCGDPLARPADVAEPPTVATGFDADPSAPTVREFGPVEVGIVLALLAIVAVLSAAVLRIR